MSSTYTFQCFINLRTGNIFFLTFCTSYLISFKYAVNIYAICCILCKLCFQIKHFFFHLSIKHNTENASFCDRLGHDSDLAVSLLHFVHMSNRDI